MRHTSRGIQSARDPLIRDPLIRDPLNTNAPYAILNEFSGAAYYKVLNVNNETL